MSKHIAEQFPLVLGDTTVPEKAPEFTKADFRRDLNALLYAARRCVLVPSTAKHNEEKLREIVLELDKRYDCGRMLMENPLPKENKWRA